MKNGAYENTWKITLQTITKKSQICLPKGLGAFDLFSPFLPPWFQPGTQHSPRPQNIMFLWEKHTCFSYIFPFELGYYFPNFLFNALYSPCSMAGLNVRLLGVRRWYAAWRLRFKWTLPYDGNAHWALHCPTRPVPHSSRPMWQGSSSQTIRTPARLTCTTEHWNRRELVAWHADGEVGLVKGSP